MKRYITLLATVFSLFSLQAQAPYYSGTEGLTGTALKDKLSAIITNGHTTNNYGDLYELYEKTDCYGTDTVWDMYSMDGQGNAQYYYRYGQDQECGEYSAEGDCYNREHSVPASWFNDNYPMYADLFIVYPTDGYVNNRRSNYIYGEVSSPTWTSTNGSKLGTNSYSGGPSQTAFEPIDAYKGDFARTYFYVATRYKDVIPNWDFTTNLQYFFNTDGTLQDWAVQMLIEWSNLDPVSQKEIDRNNEVYKIQGNRNPFIDHPEWINTIWGDGTVPAYMFLSVPVTAAEPNKEYSYTVVFKATDPATTLTLSATTLPSWLTLTTVDDTSAVLSGTPTEEGNYTVTLQLSDGSTTQTQTFTIKVEEQYTEPGLILFENFNICPPAGWTIYSAASNHDWYCSSGIAEVNGYGADVASDDWLITCAIETEPTTLILSFYSFTGYTDNNTANPEMKVLYSTDFVPGNNPEDYTWTELSYNYPAENSFQWTQSGDINVNSPGKIYFAFHYKSSGTASGEATDWKLDSVKVIDRSLITSAETINTKALKIYPNPLVKNDLTIVLPQTSPTGYTVEIFSADGKKVYSQTIQTQSETIKIHPNLSKGFYILRIKSNETYVSKFLKL